MPHDFGLNSGPATSVHAGDGNGRGRRDEGPEDAPASGRYFIGVTLPDGSNVELPFDPAAAWAIVCHQVADRLDAAAAVLAADPWSSEPLDADAPWEEGDGDYANRLGGLVGTAAEPFVGLSGFDLDSLGELAGLPRARLVLVEG